MDYTQRYYAMLDEESVILLKLGILSDETISSIWCSLDYEPREMYSEFVSFERYEHLVYSEAQRRGIVG